MTVFEGPLGRLPATDDRHLQKFSLTAATLPTVPTPVVLGTDWHTGFDNPVQRDGAFWLPDTNWGRVRGGHAYCLLPPTAKDYEGWWSFYNQRSEGACVGFAVARMMTLLNRRRYDGRTVYHEALKIDEWPGEADTGTSVRAGHEVARTRGMWRVRRGEITGPFLAEGISEYRWCRTLEDIAYCLDPASDGKLILDRGYLEFLNSWGTAYPHITRMSFPTVRELVFQRPGDAALAIDRI